MTHKEDEKVGRQLTYIEKDRDVLDAIEGALRTANEGKGLDRVSLSDVLRAIVRKGLGLAEVST